MANTKVTGALIADATITATNIADGAVTAAKLTGITTTSIAEGDKLFYTDARVSTYLSSNGYDTAANIIATITDSAPVTLDTLNELAAALGDDPNYATTTANLIGTKLPLSGGTLTGTLNIVGPDEDQLRLGTAVTERYQIGRDSSAGLLHFYGTQSGYTGYVFGGIDGERMRIDSSGNVGIGAVNPSDKLVVIGDISTTATIKLTGNSSTPSAGAFIHRPASNELALGTTSTERMRIDSAGNVGIGTTPKAWATAGSTKALQISTRGALWEAYNGVYLSNNMYYDGSTKYIESDEAGAIAIGGDGTIYFQNAVSGTAGSVFTWNERMRIDSSGRVGIGAVPSEILTIQRSSGNNLANFNTSDGVAKLYVGTTNLSGGGIVGAAIGDGIVRATQDLLFSAGGAIERMRIDSSGRVGIGTSSPNAIAHLVGQGGSGWTGGARNILHLQNANVSTTNVSNGIAFGDQTSAARWFILNDPNANGTTAEVLTISNTGGERMRIDSSGNIGLGVGTNPTTPLLTNPGRGNLTVGGAADSIVTLGINGTWYGYYYATTADLYLAHNGGNIQLQAGGSTKMHIASGGNVGIGTTSPASLFHIKSDAPILTSESTNTVSGFRINVLGAGNQLLRVQNAGTTKLQVDPNGAIYLGGSTATANALDDYEEGTWTPTFYYDFSPPSITYSVQTGYYTKIGNMVTVWFDLYASGMNSTSYYWARLGGLPFTMSNNTQYIKSFLHHSGNSNFSVALSGGTNPVMYDDLTRNGFARGNDVDSAHISGHFSYQIA